MGIGTTIMNHAGRTGLQIQKHMPKILTIFGTIGIAVGTGLTIHHTLKYVPDILDRHYVRLSEIKNDPSYISLPTQEHRRLVGKTYTDTAFALARVYVAPLGMTAAGTASLLGAKHILTKRNVALMSAYAALDEAYKNYREHVREVGGEQLHKDALYGIKETEIEETTVDEKGKEKVTVKKGYELREGDIVFDELSPNWSRNPVDNLTFLRSTEQMMNDILNARGHLFLNEVYDALGYPHTTQGAVVGWLRNDGVGYVDFGIYDILNEAKRDFINHVEAVVPLNFNYDGIIYDMI